MHRQEAEREAEGGDRGVGDFLGMVLAGTSALAAITARGAGGGTRATSLSVSRTRTLRLILLFPEGVVFQRKGSSDACRSARSSCEALCSFTSWSSSGASISKTVQFLVRVPLGASSAPLVAHLFVAL